MKLNFKRLLSNIKKPFSLKYRNPLEIPIPQTLEEALKNHKYLMKYLESLDQKPQYFPKLDLAKNLGSNVSVLYPVGQGIFIHIDLSNRKYIIVEPPKPKRKLLEVIETAMARILAEEDIELDGSKKVQVVLRYFDKALKRSKLKLDKYRKQDLLYYFLREKIGHGFLDPFLLDEWLEDISIPGAGPVFVYHRIYGYLESSITISKDEVDRLLRSIAERYGKVLSYANPIIDIHLPDGSRFNIVFGEDISLHGSNFTIRKFSKEPLSVGHLVKWNTFNATMAAYMWMLIEAGLSFFVCGETASGKTTTLNALLAFIPPFSKIVSIEETPEVRLPHKNWVREVTRMHTGSPVTMFDLVKAALRQRPDYIVIGEIRGEEGRIAFQAIETGHPVVSTMHAGTLGQLFQRITSDPINVPKSHIDGLNLAIFQARIERGGKFIRRVTSVNEIIGYNSSSGKLMFLPSFTYDPDVDKLSFAGTSYLLETKVLPFRGWSKDKLPDLYDELNKRAEIIKWHANNAPSYFDVWKTIIEVDRVGVDEVYKRITGGLKPWRE
ncbi:MAG: type II/IV secretion system ATPase subunit [archaeon GB-1867-035]|nr:type II/IV secretion system ATPase subunit [Candidatus Culexmicrobium profundum]